MPFVFLLLSCICTVSPASTSGAAALSSPHFPRPAMNMYGGQREDFDEFESDDKVRAPHHV